MASSKVEDFVGIHKDVPAVIVGSAPSATLFNFDTFKGLVFTVNDVELRFSRVRPDFSVIANHLWVRPWLIRDSSFVNYSTASKFFLSTSAYAYQNVSSVLNKILLANQLCGEKLVYFTQNHNNYQSTDHGFSGCCEAVRLLSISTSIQNVFSDHFKLDDVYGSGSTGALHALSIAVLMGCNPISFAGIELPALKSDYIYKSNNVSQQLVNFFGSQGPFPGSDDTFEKIYSTARYRLRLTRDSFLRNTFIRAFLTNIDPSFKYSVFYQDIPDLVKDFSFIVAAHKNQGADFYNYSPDSILNQVKGIDHPNKYI